MTVKRQLLLLVLMVLAFINFFRLFQSGLDHQLPDPVPIVPKSFHVNGHEDAWIQEIRDDGTVLVQTVDDKTNIHFRPLPRHLDRFSMSRNPIVAVTFECGKKPEEECNLSEPYTLYIKNVPVELLELKKKKTAD
ncbi:MAG: hypothetical protein Q8Q89_02540 [bacterium]|nr:hypothetical protein [bacterium]